MQSQSVYCGRGEGGEGELSVDWLYTVPVSVLWGGGGGEGGLGEGKLSVGWLHAVPVSVLWEGVVSGGGGGGGGLGRGSCRLAG